MARLVAVVWIYILSVTVRGYETSDLFTSLTEDFWAWSIEEFPEFATRSGYNKYNDRLESYNMTAYTARKAKVDEFFGRLKAINKDDLDEENKLNYVILEDNFRRYTEGFTYMKFGAVNPVSFMHGEQTSFRRFLGVPFRNKMDFENFITRITLLKTRVAEYTELCREAVRLNRTHHQGSVAKVPGQIQMMLVADPTQSALYTPFTDKLGNITGISPSDKADLRSRAVSAIRNNVLRPFREFKTFLENEYMPYTRRAAGVWIWDQGRNYYESCLKHQLSIDMTPEEVHAQGLAEVARISKAMLKVIRSQNFQGSIPEYFNSIRSDKRFKFPSADAIIEAYKDMIFNRINPKLNRIFSYTPATRVRVARLPYDGPIGYYSNKGVFYANVFRPKQTNSYDMVPLALHETNPGYHLQITYQLQKDLPNYRKYINYQMYQVPFTFPRYTSYSEGWGLYAEALGVEMGVYKDNYELLGRYSMEMLRACRLVVDTGMHVLRWTREDAIQYMSNYTSIARSEIENEVDRYMAYPAQACAYKIGELKLWEYRRKAEKELGKDFNLKEFHTVVLDLGSVPLHLVEEAVNQMIERGKASHAMFNRSSHGIVIGAAILALHIMFGVQ